ncbi:tripartite motif-containing protein 16 [Pangasianodon hypophthalmus]|uniref:tripartite motif-containing protein 16 n=1 Tax=Pangasianodon hypophthalmus TaxID=310915 RepID=UPI00230828CA|nr:tripartite motif-containing protein 16 [Pangasianodon hypophthalmus]
MAEAEKSYYEEQFSCSVCLDVLKEPVTIPCGHSYCMCCINDFWSGLDLNAVYSCPQCRETFSPRPALKKNTLLAQVMEKMKNASDQATTSNQDTSPCIRLECDFCIGAKNAADKFCLQCLASYCELHLEPHYRSPVFMKHKLVPASAQVQENICSHHGKLLDVYCCDDQQCICYLCMVESHKDHKSSSVESERIKNQDALEKTKIACQHMIAQREEGLMELTKAVTSIKCFAKAAEEESERMFTELINSVKRRCSEVKTLIRAQEKAELSRAEELCQRLDCELAELRARMAKIEQLLSTNNHIKFIREHASVRAMPMFKALPSITCVETSGNISISDVKEHLEDVCQQEVARIAREVMNIHVVEPSEPETREDFLQYFCDLHVDPNTIDNSLSLSEGDRKVSQSPPAHPYPDHPERFNHFANVLCKEDLYGRCYWEADCSGNDWSVAVSYKGIMRKGDSNECRLGFNAKSWRLSRSNQRSYFRHNQIVINLRQFNLTTIGVYLNHSAGTLSFYSVSDKMTLLHKVQTTFTEPVYAGFGVGGGSVVRIRKKC